MEKQDTQQLTNEPIQGTVFRTYEFEVFKLWRSLPHYWKVPPRDRDGNRPAPRDFAESMGIDDEDILELVQIPTQEKFAERYGLNRRTLWEWARMIDNSDEDPMADLKKWAKRLSSNVVLAMYNAALSTKMPTAYQDRMNFLKFAGFVERSSVELGTPNGLFDYIKKKQLQRENKKNDNSNTNQTR